MATIRKRGKKSYEISVTAGTDSAGKKIRHTLTYKPAETAPSKIKKEVLAAAVEFERKIVDGKYYAGDKMKFSEMAELWQKMYVAENCGQSTAEGYARMIDKRINPVIGHLVVRKIQPLQLMTFYRSMADEGLSTSTIKRYHDVISGVFKYAFKAGLIEDNPCLRVTLPKAGQKYQYQIWTGEQVDTFFAALRSDFELHYKERHRTDGSGNVYTIAPYDITKHLSEMYVAMYSLSIFSSARRGEICALTWEDVDFIRQEIRITKSVAKTKDGQLVKPPKTAAGIRRITVPARCINALKEWKKDQIRISFLLGSAWQGYQGKEFDKNWLFIQIDSGKMINIDTIGQKFKSIVRAYNAACKDPAAMLPDIRLHDLRHTGASLMIANNVDIVTVSHRLGHAKPSTTMDIYSHALPLKDQEASRVLDAVISS